MRNVVNRRAGVRGRRDAVCGTGAAEVHGQRFNIQGRPNFKVIPRETHDHFWLATQPADAPADGEIAPRHGIYWDTALQWDRDAVAEVIPPTARSQVKRLAPRIGHGCGLD